MNTPFAIIETGGKQYRVSEGDTITIEHIKGGYNEGDKIVFDKVLMTDTGKDSTIGTPYLPATTVEATLTESGLSKKVTVIRYKAKSRYFKKKGHRQPYMKVQITKV